MMWDILAMKDWDFVMGEKPVLADLKYLLA